MKYKLINQPNKDYSPIKQILINRGIKQQDIQHYLNLTDQDINDYSSFGRQVLKNAATALILAIKNNTTAYIILDSDCDGFTSSALLINYLHTLFPTWVQTKLIYKMHTGKQHGLEDFIDEIQENKIKLVICPDSSSNNYEQHSRIKKYGGTVIVLDHHLADSVSKDAIVINNQLSNYPNKELSGVGVTWQFCRYIDEILQTNYANQFIDLVALGLTGDMMSLHSFETKYLITKGFMEENLHNPFIMAMIDKNNFPLKKGDYVSNNPDMACTSIGAAFFIVPFVNAMTRSGTQQQKQLLFNSMLNHKAFNKVLSNKRGHKLGEQETLLAQAIRTVTNVKNRQTKAEQLGMALLQKKIQENNLLSHKILLFLLDPGQMEPNIRGLVANKIAAKYQRPCLVLTKTQNNMYEGSGRGYTKSGIDSFKEILEKSKYTEYSQGHNNAFGFGIKIENIQPFIKETDSFLKDMSLDAVYRVDYEFNEQENNNEKIITIAQMNDFWGQDIDRTYIKINFKITDSNFKIMKNNTFKFNLLNNLSVIRFGGTEEETEKFTTSGYLELNAICKCNKNEWNGNIYPQLILEDYEIVDSSKYYF